MNKNNEFIEKAINGDDEAFVKLIDTCKWNLYKIAFSYLKNEQDSLDAIGDTVYKAYINIHKLKEPLFFNTWITKILINLCINKLKKYSKIVYMKDYETVNKSTSLEMDIKVSNKIDLYNALDTLDIKYKNLIILKYFEDMTISQISKLLKYPEGTIKVYLKRSLEKLRIQLKGELN
ncbi:sigma-70 family RNA polymerase sigma factor [Clostridium botulinum C]|uniref:sigma-70 family RNA polymerase sigma factor n=1 Tax=Clostridium botulinum TaxID=1491 RepID=UPI001E4716FA|nr:sigma-70 family RNA polymerase sigma factor [Clostridium botulinum]MCD3218179.1 sigma-70 family RNA polymerase sigma factor [Clostridium botulinum C]